MPLRQNASSKVSKKDNKATDRDDRRRMWTGSHATVQVEMFVTEREQKKTLLVAELLA